MQSLNHVNKSHPGPNMSPSTTSKPPLDRPPAASFWTGTHPLCVPYLQVYRELVPAVGEAHTPTGELLRCLSKVYRDVYNNGFCNGDTLNFAVQVVESAKPEVLPYLFSTSSWRGSLSNLLEKAGKACRAAPGTPAFIAGQKAQAQLEDIATAVVRHVLARNGFVESLGALQDEPFEAGSRKEPSNEKLN